MSEEIIIIEHLTKTYKIFKKSTDRVKEALNPFHKRYSRDFYALHDLSFDVKTGETIGIIGKNGAGKSTLLKILTGVLTASTGNIWIKGKIAALLELGAGFNPEMTGIENIYLNGAIMGFSKREMDEKLQRIIDFADIGDFINQPVKMYSSGMFARLAFAVNANVEPDILIVDEALAVGDIFFQNKCFRKFTDLRKKGTTILFVSHDISSVKQLCSRVIWLDHGKIKMIGNTDEICDTYFNEEIENRNESMTTEGNNAGHFSLSLESDSEAISFRPLQEKKGDILSYKAKIVSFMIFDRDGNETKVMENGHQYNIITLLEAGSDINNGILGITLSNRKGVDIIGTNTFSISEGKTFSVLKDENLEVKFTFTMPDIIPGSYIWDVAAADGTQESHVILTWLHGVQDVEVINETSNKLGLIGIDCDVQLRKHQSHSTEL